MKGVVVCLLIGYWSNYNVGNWEIDIGQTRAALQQDLTQVMTYS